MKTTKKEKKRKRIRLTPVIAELLKHVNQLTVTRVETERAKTGEKKRRL